MVGGRSAVVNGRTSGVRRAAQRFRVDRDQIQVSTGDLTLPPTNLPREAVIDATVRSAQAGDQVAFARLYDQHVGRVYALCLRMTADPARASELLQDVFVRAWHRLGSFRGESAFSSWLHRLAVNVVLQEGRGRARRQRRVALAEDLGGTAGEFPARSGEPGLRLDLERAVAALPAPSREVFVLHDIEGYRHDEISAELHMPASTCRSHLFRARRLLREMLR
ncbi:MAG TPA: sigma-70 family RNA polymerase sigma factor [Gemmatimonadales bacterium]|nr:sigma-70 family RNA polymerase sigma factor [Gemmatimonadales bacterium]